MAKLKHLDTEVLVGKTAELTHRDREGGPDSFIVERCDASPLNGSHQICLPKRVRYRETSLGLILVLPVACRQ